ASFEVAYVPSLGALARSHESANGSAPIDLLAFANPAVDWKMVRFDATMVDLNPLPFSDHEVRFVRGIVSTSELLQGASASEVALKSRRLATYKIIHFATHALLDPISPDRSAIILARGADDQDGLLQPREIAALPLGGQLVVLSGCETASGQISSAEGALSLGRAFLYAG